MEKLEGLKDEQNARVRLSLSLKPLLKKLPPNDGILLFGKHKGEKISSLLNSYDGSSYVLEYLSKSKDLPKTFRNDINDIVDAFNPFDADLPPITGFKGLKVREVDDNEELPW